MSLPLVPPMPVLTDRGLPPDFQRAIADIGSRWQAPSGRAYLISLAGDSVGIALERQGIAPPPSEEEIDLDLLELVAAIHEAVPGEWSSLAVRNVARAWGWDVPR